jgi:hypothetical protein
MIDFLTDVADEAQKRNKCVDFYVEHKLPRNLVELNINARDLKLLFKQLAPCVPKIDTTIASAAEAASGEEAFAGTSAGSSSTQVDRDINTTCVFQDKPVRVHWTDFRFHQLSRIW